MSSILMAWKGADQKLRWATTTDGVSFSQPPQFRGDLNSSQGPALAAFNGRLYMAWKAIDTINHQQIGWTSTLDGINFDLDHLYDQKGINSSQGPALAAFNGKLYMVWKGMEGDQKIWLTSTSDGVNFDTPKITHEDHTSYKGPALAALNDKLFLAWEHADNQKLYWANNNAPGFWDGPYWHQHIDFNSDQGPVLVVF